MALSWVFRFILGLTTRTLQLSPWHHTSTYPKVHRSINFADEATEGKRNWSWSLRNSPAWLEARHPKRNARQGKGSPDCLLQRRKSLVLLAVQLVTEIALKNVWSLRLGARAYRLWRKDVNQIKWMRNSRQEHKQDIYRPWEWVAHAFYLKITKTTT